ncbi:PAS domain S-box protein [Aerosakkonemataceae cyanobacterium BLCC-F50]|uniref:histidine kinase n=1 Tax=Floridaenema flaviceps BLCC-F50 TaxID=3153642 RepID=A0ABV4XIG9_9CYAN
MNRTGNHNSSSSAIWRYSIAILTVSLVLGINLLLEPLFDTESPVLLFFTAVIISALYGGIWAGVLATILSALICDRLFLFPLGYFFVPSVGQSVKFILFIWEGVFISYTIGQLNIAKQRLIREKQALEEKPNSLGLKRESEPKYAVFLLDAKGAVASWNQQAENLKGYQAKEIIGKHFSCFYLPEDIAQKKPDRYLQIAATEGHIEKEGWRIRQDGSRFWANAIITALRDEKGNLTGFCKLTRDLSSRRQTEDSLQEPNNNLNLETRIQERTAQLTAANRELQQQIEETRKAEAALQMSEQRFRAIFNQTFQFMGLMKPDGTLIEANETALKFGGLKREDAIDRPFWQTRWWTISRETQERLKQAIQQAANNQFVRYEVEVLGAKDTVITIDFSIKPICDESGQVVLLIPEGRDISERKQAEQTLQSFFDAAPMMMGIVELIEDRDILHIADNATTAKFFGVEAIQESPVQKMPNATASEMGAPKEHIQQWIKHYREAERTQAPVRFEYTHVTQQGERWLSATVSLISGKLGSRSRFAYIVEDITDRKLVEAQIHQLNAELEQRVQKRTAQLQIEIAQRERALQELQQTEEALRQSEAQFRMVAETMPQIVWTALPDGAVDYYNQRWTEFSGIPQTAGCNWGWQPILHPEDEQRTVEAWKKAVQTGEFYECEHRLRRADGEFRWFLSRSLPLCNSQGQIIKWFGTATDIHEQKQVQEALRQSEQRFRAAVDNIPDTFVIYDAERRLQFVNAEGLHRTKKPLEALLGRRDEEIYPPEVTDDYLPFLQWSVETLTTQSFECTTTLPSYGTYTAIISYIPLLNEQGELYQILGITHDITKRKRAEEALRLSLERFRIALENSPIAVFNQDRQLRYTWIYNPRLGYKADEVLGKTDADLMHPDDAAKLTEIKQRVLLTGNGVREEVHASKNGEFSYYELNVEPLRDESDRIVGITASAIDITERKRTEAQLQIRAKQQAAIASLGQKALSGINLDELMKETTSLIAQILNVEYCEILELLPDTQQMIMRSTFGFPEELIGQSIVSTGLQSQAGYTLHAWEPVIVNDLTAETRFTPSPFCQEYQIISGLSTIIAGVPQPFGVLQVHTTSKYSFTQDDIHFLQAGANILAEAIQRQKASVTLHRQSEELALANRLKDEFLATISHELRTPLNSMLGWAKLLPTRNFSQETVSRAIETISRNTQALAQLIEDVLDMSDIIRGRLNLQVEPVSLDLVIEGAIASINLAAEAKNIQICSQIDDSVGIVLGDASRLQQIVWNLLSNSVKFTPNGGRVEVRLTTINHLAQIQVSDTGRGISRDFLPHVFDRFRQEDGSITRSYGGLGLGLAIVRYLVELHGGTIQAESPGYGQGATFTVQLPLL